MVMKSLKYILFSFCLFKLLTGCEQDLEVYKGESSIYFSMENDDTITYSWGTIDADIREAEMLLRVDLFGKVTNYPRTFSIRVVSDFPDSVRAEEGVNYVALPLVYEMPPMSDHAIIPITLLRDSVKETSYFEIILEENEEFGFDYMRWIQPEDTLGNPLEPYMYDDHRVIKQDEKFPQPSWWITMEEWLGDWSSTKGELICEVMDLDRKQFQLPLDSDGALTYAKMRYIAIQVAYWLWENPTLEEDGEEMEMGEEAYYNM